jgi:hypothetical protein
MSAAQKAAWFNLIVIVLTIVTVAALSPRFGARAAGGFGTLGLCGVSGIFFLRRRGRVVSDERDVLINHRSNIVAYSVFWLAFVAAVMSAQPIFGDSVPVNVIQWSVWVSFMIVLGVQAIATLVQYGIGAPHGE